MTTYKATITSLKTIADTDSVQALPQADSAIGDGQEINKGCTEQWTATETSSQDVHNPEPTPKKRRSRKGGELTKKKTEALATNEENTTQLATGIDEVSQQLRIQQGALDGAQSATLYLQAKTATYNNIMAQATALEVQQLAEQIQATAQNFDPNAILSKAGVALPLDTLSSVQNSVAVNLTKIKAMVAEVVETSLPG